MIPCFDMCQLIISWISNTKEVHSKPRLHVSLNLFFGVWYGRHVVRLRRRRRREYAPTSNTASHDNHEKINSWVSFCFPYMGCLWGSASRPFGPPELRYNCLSLTDEDNSLSRTDNFVNVNVFNTVTSARVLSYRWVLHYFSTIPVGRIKIVTI